MDLSKEGQDLIQTWHSESGTSQDLIQTFSDAALDQFYELNPDCDNISNIKIELKTLYDHGMWFADDLTMTVEVAEDKGTTIITAQVP